MLSLVSLLFLASGAGTKPLIDCQTPEGKVSIQLNEDGEASARWEGRDFPIQEIQSYTPNDLDEMTELYFMTYLAGVLDDPDLSTMTRYLVPLAGETEVVPWGFFNHRGDLIGKSYGSTWGIGPCESDEL